MRTRPGWKLCTLLLVIAAHAWLGWTLANYRPDGTLARTRPRAQAHPDELLLVIEFKERIAPAIAVREPSPPRPRRRLPPAVDAPAAGPAVADAGADAATAPALDAGRPLDLRPPPLAPTQFARANPLERAAPALAYEKTRYDGAYISTGNLTEVVARRSQVAMVVLSVLGALRKDCTEKQRANYERECVPDAYEHKPGNE